MNDPDQGDAKFESELIRLKPAELPDLLRQGLLAAGEQSRLNRNDRTPIVESPWKWWAWLAPLAAAAGIAVVLILRRTSSTAAEPGSRPPDIEVNRDLIASFETVVTMPDGQPVRFSCREWSDETVFRDRSRGLVVEDRVPRLEIVPVGFEIY